jgi:hypothetical protein
VAKTYKQIQREVKRRFDFVPKTCWIADAKSRSGYNVRRAPNRQTSERKHPCPPDKFEAIVSCLGD